jgi:hypothetical protein
METTRKRRIVRLVAFVLPIMLILFAGMVWAVFGLWNWLMPSIFGLRTITYWQALGLMALSWILFRGFRGPRFSGGSWRHGVLMRERWGKMTPAEREEFAKGLRSVREEFVKGFRSRWSGGTTPPEPEPKA